jgi:transcriptional regulator with XRE-family HTH domain|nr:helix-turn-helix transcriptional regulator [uncultured Prevotella sp.]
MDLNVIKRLAEKRVGGLKKLAADIGMSEANLHRCINNNKMQGGDLEQIANIFGVSVDVFFDSSAETYFDNVMNLQKIKLFIEQKGIGIVSLATKVNVSRIALENILNGADVKISTVEALAKALNVKVVDLFNDKEITSIMNVEAPSVDNAAMYEELIALRAENKVLRELQGLSARSQKRVG